MKIGFIGTGVMGNAMIGHLMNNGFEVNVYTRTKAKADNLVKDGAIWQESPKEVAKNSDVVITIVGYPSDVEEVYFGKDSIIEGIKEGSIVVDMTTSTPKLAKRIYDEFKKINVASIDAPVSGGDVGAKNATLTIMCGGDQEAFDKLDKVFSAMGKTIVLQGPAGSGQHTKMCNQIALAGSMLGMVEYIKYAQVNGLDPEKVLESIGMGSAGSTAINVYTPRIFKGDYAPGFYIKHYVKDLKIAIDVMKEENEELEGLNLVYKLYKTLEDNQLGDEGTQALIKYYIKG